VDSWLDYHQFGSLKRWSTSHTLADMLHRWNKALDDGHSVCVLCFNYAKAFGHIDHNTVIQKLNAFGVHDFIICWMLSFLRAHQQWVKLSENIFRLDYTEWRHASWFLSWTYDPHSSHQWLKILARFTDSSTTQCCLKSSWRVLTCNTHWTQYFSGHSWIRRTLTVRRPRRWHWVHLVRKLVPLTVASMAVDHVTVYKLLGVTVNSALTLKWDDHVAAIISKVAKRL